MEEFKPEASAANSTQSTKLSLVDIEEGQIASFNPSFTYPIFGEAEQVFGYKNLEMLLAFDSRNFTPFINVKFSDKLDDDLLLEKAKMDKNENYSDSESESQDGEGYDKSEEQSQDLVINKAEFDPLTKYLQFLPADDITIKDESKWSEKCQSEKLALKDTLEKDGEIISTDNSTTIYKINIKKFKHFYDRIKIFTLFFVEAASYIDDTDESWDVYVMLDNKNSKLIGYATCYKYWFYDGGCETFDALKHVPDQYSYKGRISQFLILPTFQNQKMGTKLYNAIYDHWLKVENIKEINIEDPNEMFDALRDKADFKRLIDSKFEKNINCTDFKGQTISKSKLEKIYIDLLAKLTQQFKFETKQGKRMMEILFIYLDLDDFIKLIIMKRIYLQNFELLQDFDEEDKKDKLYETYENVKQEYFERIPSLIRDESEPPVKKAKV